MLGTTLHTLFYFGTAVRYLQDVRPGERIADDSGGGRRVRTNLRVVLQTMEELQLSGSLSSAATTNLRQLLEQLVAEGETGVLSSEQASVLGANIDRLRAMLESELRATQATVPSRVDDEARPAEPAALFAPQVYAVLPAAAKFDLTEAARCTAFAASTAAAFHLLRAVAAVLRAFYASGASWRRTADHTQLFNRLQHIRTAFPDPCQLPEARLGPDQVRRLWAHSIDVINRMAPALAATTAERSVESV